MLITKEEKLEIVPRHLLDGITLRELAEEYHPDRGEAGGVTDSSWKTALIIRT